ncbi:unnamed protein product [Arabis nemorensis]|uniref:Uncharacterized protein n=1 Tax=Arabis nemorensis TaxID=586526 RepID=A0A565ATZ4_9BRAS|nr:unnamed protein product [Arabis nemorensis]
MMSTGMQRMEVIEGEELEEMSEDLKSAEIEDYYRQEFEMPNEVFRESYMEIARELEAALIEEYYKQEFEMTKDTWKSAYEVHIEDHESTPQEHVQNNKGRRNGYSAGTSTETQVITHSSSTR